MPPFPGFIGAEDTPQSQNVNTERCVNWYLEQSTSRAAKTPNALLPAPGFQLFTTLPDSPVRGLFAQNDRTLGVGGTSLFEVLRDRSVALRPMTALATPAAPIITTSDLVAPLARPSRPLVTTIGAPGTTLYWYVITAHATTPAGETQASEPGILTTGNAALDGTNSNAITWNQVVGATGYSIFKSLDSGATWRVLSTSTSGTILRYLDDGLEPGVLVDSPALTNSTGDPAGMTTYGYQIAAVNQVGETLASVEGVTHTGQPTLGARLYTIVTWVRVPGATGYRVYRTTGGPAPPRLIATVSNGRTLSIQDTGAAGTAATLPVANTTLGTGLANDGIPVTWASSGDAGRELLIQSGGHGYLLDLDTNLFSPVVDGATQVGYVDGFFVALDAGTSTLRVSGLLDGYLWDPSQVTQRIAGADRWLALIVIHREIWLFGSQSTEVWYNAGTSPFPFAPLPSVFIEKGIVAPLSVCAVDGVPVWLGQDIQGSGTVWRANGYTPERVSTHALEYALSQYTLLADAEAWSYQQDGHTFYVLTFPSEGHTWVLDTITGAWHERGDWNERTNRFDAYRPNCHAFAFSGLGVGTHLVGDRETGWVLEMGTAWGVDVDGSAIRRVRRCPHLADDGARIILRKIQIDLEAGLGLQIGQGSEPTLMLKMSNDGGKVFGSERWVSAGRTGQYRTRAIWRNWGAPRDAVFELVCTDPTPFRLAQAFLNNPDGVV